MPVTIHEGHRSTRDWSGSSWWMMLVVVIVLSLWITATSTRSWVFPLIITVVGVYLGLVLARSARPLKGTSFAVTTTILAAVTGALYFREVGLAVPAMLVIFIVCSFAVHYVSIKPPSRT